VRRGLGTGKHYELDGYRNAANAGTVPQALREFGEKYKPTFPRFRQGKSWAAADDLQVTTNKKADDFHSRPHKSNGATNVTNLGRHTIRHSLSTIRTEPAAANAACRVRAALANNDRRK
jgi:hypothetical protein